MAERPGPGPKGARHRGATFASSKATDVQPPEAPAVLRAYLSVLRKTVPLRGLFLLGLMLVNTAAEGVGILLLVPLLGLVGLDVGEGSLGTLSEFVATGFSTLGIEPTLLGVLAVFAVVTGMTYALKYQTSLMGAKVNQSLALHLRKRLYEAVSRMEWRYYSRARSSDFYHALTDEVNRVSGLTSQALGLVTQALVASVYLVIALAIAPLITLITASGAGLLLLALRPWNARARTAGEAISEASSAMYSGIHEHLAGMKTAKSYGAEDRSIRMFAELAERVSGAYVRVVGHHASFSALVGVGSVLLLSSIVFLAVEVMAVPVAGLLLLLFLFARLVPRFSAIQKSYHQLLNVLPAFRRTIRILQHCEERAETPAMREAAATLQEGIELREIRFAYPGSDGAPVLRGLSLRIEALQTTAVVGPSGVGKSTVADLIMGLLRPDAGEVRVDGAPLGPEHLRAWRERIGYVPQEPFLFHDTVRANLLWARPDATEEDLWAALRQASAEAFVASMPHDLDTLVGDRGVLLSGGERQRLVLARALLRNPDLLLLDEATSALDGHHEAEIMRAIGALQGQMTILIITHRIATTRTADRIHVLEAGRVVETGTWDALLEIQKGRFRELCRIQGIRPESTHRSARPGGL
jgi:ATP-binding cassette, subfamily C, bacterial